MSQIVSTDVMVSVPAMISVHERNGVVEVCASLHAIEETERIFTVTLATNDGTGRNYWFAAYCIKLLITGKTGADYHRVSSTEVFPLGSTNVTTRCVYITILRDDILEGDQTFAVMLATLDPDVLLGNAMTTITIIDG